MNAKLENCTILKKSFRHGAKPKNTKWQLCVPCVHALLYVYFYAKNIC